MSDGGMDAEVVIVGAGLAGAATAWRLAQRGVDALVVERTRPANAEGSSHGSARATSTSTFRPRSIRAFR